MLTNALNPPEIVGRVDPKILSELEAGFPDQRIGVEWYREENDRHGGNPELLNTLEPLHHMILQQEVQNSRGLPWGVYYAVDTRKVPFGKTQRQRLWHVDGDGHGRSFIVANTQPTEFLVKAPGLSYAANLTLLASRLALLKQTQNLTFGYLSKEDIERNNLMVYRPEPYELACMGGHIHRSPTNHSAGTIIRTWVRAAIVRKKILRS